jgi:hypothetical protein
MVRAATLAIFLIASTVISSAESQNAAADARQRDAFLSELQRASQAGDRSTIAAMIRYPITIAIGGFRVPFRDAAAFLERYDDIFNPTLGDAIARGSNGVTIEMVNGQWRITAITVPRPAAGESAPVAPPGEPATSGARTPEPRRVAIRVGPRPTQIPGVLGRDATDSLLLYLPKGRLAGIRLERVPAGSAALRVVHARTGAPLSARTSADGRFVSGRPPESADYRIDVRRTDNRDDGPLPYMLSLTLR